MYVESEQKTILHIVHNSTSHKKLVNTVITSDDEETNLRSPFHYFLQEQQ